MLVKKNEVLSSSGRETQLETTIASKLKQPPKINSLLSLVVPGFHVVTQSWVYGLKKAI